MAREQLPRKKTLMFLVASTRRQRVVVVSKIRFWISHWDISVNQSRRCGGSLCWFCQMGVSSQYRYVCLVVDQAGEQKLVELRNRHYGLMERLRNQPKGELGAVLVIKKMGEARNSPVEITATDQEQVIEQDISRLVETLGLAPKFIQDAAIAEESAVDKLLEETQRRLESQFNVDDLTQ